MSRVFLIIILIALSLSVRPSIATAEAIQLCDQFAPKGIPAGGYHLCIPDIQLLGDNSEAKSLLESAGKTRYRDIGLCAVIDVTWDMKKAGKSKQEIDAAVDNIERNPEVMKKCICKKQAMLSEQLKNYDAVIVKYPDWKVKILSVKTINGATSTTETADLAIFEMVRQTLPSCPQS